MANPFLRNLIARRLEFQKGGSFSSNVIHISTISIALGTCILVLSALIQAGFREEIYRRIFSFGGHLSVRQFSSGTLYEEKPLEQQSLFLKNLKKLPQISTVQSSSYLPVLISNEDEVAGVVLKGLDRDFNKNAFAANLDKRMAAGPDSGEIWVSKKLARKMMLQEGGKVVAFILHDPPRYRKLKIACFYQTGIEDVDDNIALVSLNLIREINGWKPGSAGSFELFLKDFNGIVPAIQEIEKMLPYNLGLEPVTQTHSQLFEWLDIIGRNVLVMFVLVALVAGFNMAATLLIMVMERRQMIGILKAMGAEDGVIMGIFVRNGMQIMIRGMLAGNLLGLGLALLQWRFNVIPLNPESYYLDSVPVGWNWISVAGINAGVVLITWLVILLPVRMVSKIRPAEAVRV